MAKAKDPVYQVFQLHASAGRYSGKKDVIVNYETFSGLMKAVREYFKDGYTNIDVYIRGIYGRKNIKRKVD